MSSPPADEEAIHEASHLVVLLDLGRSFTQVRISFGAVRGGVVVEDKTIDENAAIIALAGTIGELIGGNDLASAPWALTPSNWAIVCMTMEFRNTDDKRIVEDHLQQAMDAYGKARALPLAQRSLGILTRRWRDVVRIAEALRARRVLTADEVAALLISPP